MKCTALVQDVSRGRARRGTRSIWELSVLPAQLCYESKTALKNTVSFKGKNIFEFVLPST